VVWLKRLSFWYRYGPEPRDVWIAGYPIDVHSSKGVRRVRVELDEIRSAECPKSRMIRSPQSDQLVQIFLQAEATSETAFGSADRWSGAFYDAWGVMRAAKARDESAQETAINKA
jgi:hypothetical protein